jgi:hypothetical protein
LLCVVAISKLLGFPCAFRSGILIQGLGRCGNEDFEEEVKRNNTYFSTINYGLVLSLIRRSLDDVK